MAQKTIGIGLMGIGVIGSKVANVLIERAHLLSGCAGCAVALRKIKVIESDLSRPQVQAMDPKLFTTDDEEFFNLPDVDIIIELIGGEYPAFEYQKRAIKAHKHVVTANKEVIAKHGAELFMLAEQNNVSIRYEASVGGGIPLIAPFQRDLIANRINGIYGIINGTTNYILSTMAKDGTDFEVALSQAQKLGYAEANPRNDIEGIDAAYKIAIMATLAFRSRVGPEQVFCEGISRLSRQDFQYAREMGFAIKLLAIAKQDDGEIEARVHPVFIPADGFLAKVDGVYNAVLVDGDLTGQVTFTGKGAGASATSSAVVADAVAIARQVVSGRHEPILRQNDKARIKPMAQIVTRYFIRMSIADQPGVLAQVASAFGVHNISIASAIQKETAPDKTAEIVIMTHPAKEEAIQSAFADFKKLDVVKEVHNFVRVEMGEYV
ncbi:MAG: homoserine dehydrogenase [Dehalococcoidia bacterium]|nr:homoserine dehydrogenase [Dehalococcoidia bacterium]